MNENRARAIRTRIQEAFAWNAQLYGLDGIIEDIDDIEPHEKEWAKMHIEIHVVVVDEDGKVVDSG